MLVYCICNKGGRFGVLDNCINTNFGNFFCSMVSDLLLYRFRFYSFSMDSENYYSNKVEVK